MQQNQQTVAQALRARNIDIDIDLLLMHMREAASRQWDHLKRYFLLGKIVTIIVLVVYVLFCLVASNKEWHGTPALAFLILITALACAAMSVNGILAGFLPKAIVEGTPDMQLGQLFTFFKENVTLPDFKTDEFFAKGKEGVKELWWFLLYIAVIAGIIMDVTELLTFRHMFGAIIALAASIVLSVYSLIDKAESKWFKRIIIGLSVPTLALGIYAGTKATTLTETREMRLLKQDALNRDEMYARRLEEIENKVADGKVLTSEERSFVSETSYGAQTNGKNFKEDTLGITYYVQLPENISTNLPAIRIPAGKYRWDIEGDARLIMKTPYRDEVINLKDNRAAGTPFDRTDYQGCGFMINGTKRGETIVSAGEQVPIPTGFNLHADLITDLNKPDGRRNKTPVIIIRFTRVL